MVVVWRDNQLSRRASDAWQKHLPQRFRRGRPHRRQRWPTDGIAPVGDL